MGLSLQIGRVRAWVSKAFGFEGRKFAVQTSAAVMSVRGTKFEVAVNEKNEVRLDVREGVVGVKTVLGEEVEVGPGRALRSLLIIPDKPLDLPPGAREEI
ncbi:MAG: FecR domain-containing protein [Elusimicrobia bacterium]|nr:FecR domain-containing protein [Elusimicrobiota bacterium]